ncbi:MAG TPA: hypothetical protein DEP66_03125 [Acidimicrobiaceae bacterium]|nr:hypothetical protein [Acidimicrobiaceae bacterium]
MRSDEKHGEGPRAIRFLDELDSMFTGAKVDGDSGFINLLRIKHQYFASIRASLLSSIDTGAPLGTPFREELFDKLYTFFHRYFCETGSVYFRHVPSFSSHYGNIFGDGADVALSWKTQMLYYIRSSSQLQSMPLQLRVSAGGGETRRFYFDASSLSRQPDSQRRDLVYAYQGIEAALEEPVIQISVIHSKRGRKSNHAAILKSARAAGVKVTADELNRAVHVFERQSAVDYFINRDATAFLEEQFDLWFYSYVMDRNATFDQERVRQLQVIRNIAYDVIAYLAQFEDELRRIWEKPKLVRGLCYVICLSELGPKIVNKLVAHEGMREQLDEWKALKLVDLEITQGDLSALLGSADSENHQHFLTLPIDTQYFKSIEGMILKSVGDFAELFDGELIFADNWQALNTLLPRYRELAQLVYLDPPYNTGNDFAYKDNFQSSSWLTLIENRLDLTRQYLAASGWTYLQLDHYADYMGRFLLHRSSPDIGPNDISAITWNTGDNISGYKTQRDNWIRQADRLLAFPKSRAEAYFTRMWQPIKKAQDKRVGQLDFLGPGKENLYLEQWVDGRLTQVPIDVDSKRIGTVWSDIDSFQASWLAAAEGLSFETQKPENLLRRIVQASTAQGDLVVDPFSGTGTTAAVAHKLGRKWLAMEAGVHGSTTYLDSKDERKLGLLGRLKNVLAGDREFCVPNSDRVQKSPLSRDIGWTGGGAFKYYSLETYEDVLLNARYDDAEHLELDTTRSLFEQYVFFSDDKLATSVLSITGDSVTLDLCALYDDVDIAESVANILGVPIRTRTETTVTLTDGSLHKIDPAIMSTEEVLHLADILKPYLWWG